MRLRPYSLGHPERKQGIPTLAVVTPAGDIVSSAGCDEVEKLGPSGALKKWKAALFGA